LGPILGAMLAVLFYRLIKMLEYETANPGQDFNAHEADAFSFDEENAATASDVMPPTAEEMRMKSNFSGSDTMSGDGGEMNTSIADMIARSQRSNSLNRTLSAGPDYVADHPNVVATATHGATAEAATTEAFHSGPDAENGTLGGNYTVSGLRHAS
jgi:aquaporin related protein